MLVFFINQIPITKEECKSALKYWDEHRKPFLIHDNYVLPIIYNDDVVIYAISNAKQRSSFKKTWLLCQKSNKKTPIRWGFSNLSNGQNKRGEC